MQIGAVAQEWGKWVDVKSTAYVNVVCQQDCSPGKPLRVKLLTKITTRVVNQHTKVYNNNFTTIHLLQSR